ncbi:MAG: chemotaxis response regulator protein-glutamate methylesterase [bacterium]
MKKMNKILIIDDSPFTRKVLKEMIESEPDLTVIDTATNGIEGLKKAIQLKPDLITLDLEMPEMDGFSFLRFLMSEQPTPVIVVSSLATSDNVFKALELGALDFVAKPTQQASLKLLDIKKDLLFKIKAALISSLRHKRQSKKERIPVAEKEPQDLNLIAIGASTGGPQALQKILTELKELHNAAILIAQHMPEGFTKVFAERLNRITPFRVSEGEDGDIIKSGNVYISPGGHHMSVIEKNSKLTIKLDKKADSDIYVPSVNHLFSSLVPFANKTLAIVLTGMGSDGKLGAIALKNAGAEIWAESIESAIIYGMPKEIVNAKIADNVLPLWDIPNAITKKLSVYD